LPTRHSVELIVHHDDGHVDVAAGAIEQMVAPDGQAVPVPGEGDNLARRLGGLQPDGGRDDASMQDLQNIGMDINSNPRATADSGGHGQIVHGSQIIYSSQKGLDIHPVTAAGTKTKGRKSFLRYFSPSWFTASPPKNAKAPEDAGKYPRSSKTVQS
jgi:hypothetical protein